MQCTGDYVWVDIQEKNGVFVITDSGNRRNPFFCDMGSKDKVCIYCLDSVKYAKKVQIGLVEEMDEFL